MKKILVVGSLNMDMVIEVKDTPKTGETILGKQMNYVPGGKGANQAYAVASAGGNITMLGCVGDDELGEVLLDNLKKSGADISQIEKKKEVSTGLAIIAVNEEGDNSIIVVPGANSLCDEAYIKEKEHLIQDCDYVILQMEIPEDTIYQVIRLANKYGKTVILNPAPAPENIPDEILSMIDYITPNETEIMTITGRTGETLEEIKEAAMTLIEKGVKNVLVTVGSRGAVLIDQKECRVFPTRKVDAVDTTAAGDCFNGAFVTALAEGAEIEKAIVFANTFSSIAVTRKGAQSSIPKREEVEKYLV